MPSGRQVLWYTNNEQPAGLQIKVFVLYTGVRRTLAALREAARLAAGLSARIEILVPNVVPHPLPIEEPPVAPSFLTSRFKALVEDSEFETSIQVYLCRDAREALASALPSRSIVAIGDRRRWWPTKERRFGCWLRSNGHRVIFVDTDSHVLEIFHA
jgi:hypothetical protein